MTETRVDKQALLDSCTELTKAYYAEVAAAENDVESIIEINEVYNKRLEHIANALLNEKPVDLIIIETAAISREPIKHITGIDSDTLQYVLANKSQLITRGLIRKHQVGAECICCARKIKGLGLLDFSDCGTAVCFDCIDTKHHYVGDGIYFTDFE